MMINIGRLNRKITFLKRWNRTDTMGQDINTEFTPYKTVWASVAPVRGNEYWEAQKIRADLIYKIIIRYKPWVMPDMQIMLSDGRIMDITAIIDPYDRHESLEIQAVEHVNTHEQTGED